MTWDEFLKLDFTGRDLETVENGVPYRGPIKSVTQQGDSIVIECHWVAKLVGGWVGSDITRMSVSKSSTPPPNHIGNDRYHFQMLYLGYATVFQKGNNLSRPQ